jgi:hypothetical protein
MPELPAHFLVLARMLFQKRMGAEVAELMR